MSIKKIEIKDFRSIQSLEISDLRQITGFFGKNGAGKSSVLASLAAMKNVCLQKGKTASDVLQDHNVNLGEIKYSLNPNNESDHIYIRLEFDDRSNNIAFIPEKEKNIIDCPEYGKIVRYFPVKRAIQKRDSSITTSVEENFLENQDKIHGALYRLIIDSNKEKAKDHSKTTKLDILNKWLEKFGFGTIDYDEDNYNKVSSIYLEKDTSQRIPIVDSSFGSRSIFFIILEMMLFENGIIIIEEPEMSLHPGAQIALMDFFVEMAKNNNHQIIFSSHSFTFLKRMVYSRGGEENIFKVYLLDKNENGTYVSSEVLKETLDGFNGILNTLETL